MQMSLKWLAKHASYGFYWFWYLPLNGVIPKVVLCDVSILFQSKTFQMLISRKRHELRKYVKYYFHRRWYLLSKANHCFIDRQLFVSVLACISCLCTVTNIMLCYKLFVSVWACISILCTFTILQAICVSIGLHFVPLYIYKQCYVTSYLCHYWPAFLASVHLQT